MSSPGPVFFRGQASGTSRPALPLCEVQDHATGRRPDAGQAAVRQRGGRSPVQDGRRPAHHHGWSLPARDVSGRNPAVLQRPVRADERRGPPAFAGIGEYVVPLLAGCAALRAPGDHRTMAGPQDPGSPEGLPGVDPVRHAIRPGLLLRSGLVDLLADVPEDGRELRQPVLVRKDISHGSEILQLEIGDGSGGGDRRLLRGGICIASVAEDRTSRPGASAGRCRLRPTRLRRGGRCSTAGMWPSTVTMSKSCSSTPMRSSRDVPDRQSNTGQAVTAYRSVLRLDSRNLKAVQGLMELYLSSRAPAGEAELIGRRFLENNNDDVGIRRMYAEALCLLRKPKEAVAELTKILDQHPDDVQSYERMGLLANEYPDVVSKPAALWFDEAIAKNPQSALAYIARAEFHLRNSRGDDAQADLEQAQKCDLPDTETRGRLVGGLMDARLLDQAKDQPKAARFLDQAREQLKAWQTKDPTEPVLWQCWTVLASRANGLALRAKDPAVLARSVEEMYTVAEAGLKALAAQPWDFMPGATELLILSDHIEEAKNCIAQMQQKDIAPQVTPYLEGLVADRQGRLRDAIAGWRKAIALGYRHPAVRRMLASALVRLGDTQSAIGELRILLTDVPGYLDAHLILAQLLVQTAEWQDALDQARIARQLSPDYAEAILLELQARLHLPPVNGGSDAEREKAWQEIETQLAQLDKTEKGSPAIELLQAQVALMRGKFPEATSMLTDLKSKYPSEVRVILLQAESYAAQDKKEEAKTQFQEAVTKFPQAFEAVRGLALLLNQQNQHPGL